MINEELNYKTMYDDLFSYSMERERHLWNIIKMLQESLDNEQKEVIRLIKALAERRD